VFRGKFLRIDRGLSQRQLAALAGMTAPTLCHIENGRINPSPSELKALGAVLGCAPERVMDAVSDALLAPGAEARDDQRA
jgi:transcriptional regulator with XRE-family HTH domain